MTFLCGWLKLEMLQCLHESLIGRCSTEESVSKEGLLSGQESPVAWLNDDRWCQWDKLSSWIKGKEMWHWKIAWLKSFIWWNGPGLVSSSLSRGVATWLSFLTSLEMAERQNAENNWSCVVNLKRESTGCYIITHMHPHSFMRIQKSSSVQNLFSFIFLQGWGNK